MSKIVDNADNDYAERKYVLSDYRDQPALRLCGDCRHCRISIEMHYDEEAQCHKCNAENDVGEMGECDITGDRVPFWEAHICNNWHMCNE